MAVEPSAVIWVLDDDERFCALLLSRFHSLGWQSKIFHQSRALLTALATETPGLLVLDEMLPERRGGDMLAALRLQGHAFPVLMLSAMRSPRDRIAGLEAGADDYLGKPFEFRELQLRIERLLAASSAPGVHQVPPPAQECYAIETLHFDVQQAQILSPNGSITRLSRGDAALLQALCRRPSEVIGRQTLARISGSLVDVSQSRSIDVRIGRLRRLLNDLLAGRFDAIESCRGQGYRIVPEVQLIEPPSGD